MKISERIHELYLEYLEKTNWAPYDALFAQILKDNAKKRIDEMEIIQITSRVMLNEFLKFLDTLEGLSLQ